MEKENKATWTLNGTELTINKNLYMRLCYYSTLPWGTDVTKVIIEDGVTNIGDYVFQCCTKLTSIVIPDSVKSIGYDAFRGCINLKKVYISDIKAWCNISFENPFSNPLIYGAELYLNDRIVTKLVIPDNKISIKSCAFLGCSSLTSIVIPDSITSIGENTFAHCSNLTSVSIGNGVKSVSKRAFNGCSNLVNVTIGNSVKSISECAFGDCSSLVSVSIGNSVTSIGWRAFCYCHSLVSIIIPNSVKSIGAQAFQGCSSLTNIVIPDGITSIGYQVFSYCKSLTSIVIPDSITSIGSFAFCECKIKSKTKNYKACKIVNNKFICLDQEYKMNKWSQKIDNIELCSCGYHFCTNLYEIFDYYHGKIDKDIAIFECEHGDEVVKSPTTSKCVTNRIKLVKRLTKNEIIEILNNPTE